MSQTSDVAHTDEAIRLGIADVSDSPTLVGRTFRTNWFQVDPAKLAEFDSATYSDQSGHEVDLSAYPEDLIEGFHLVSLLDYLVNDVLFVTGPWVAWNYGMDRVRFIHPTRARDRWRVHGTVTQVEKRSGGFLIHQSLQSEIEGQEKPGFTVEIKVLWRAGGEE